MTQPQRAFAILLIVAGPALFFFGENAWRDWGAAAAIAGMVILAMQGMKALFRLLRSRV